MEVHTLKFQPQFSRKSIFVAFLFFAAVLPGCTPSSESDIEPSLPVSDSATKQQFLDDSEDALDPLVLIERVIAAHGGRDNLQKTRIGKSHLVVTGIQGLPPGSTTDTEQYFDLPSRFRRDVTMSVAGELLTLSYVITEHGSWQRFGDQDWKPNPLAPGKTPLAFPSSSFDVLLTLVEAPNMHKVSSSKTPQGKELLVLRLEADGRWNGDMYVDPETHLMFSSNHPIYSHDGEELVVTHTFYKDYKTIDGVVVPFTAEAFVDGKLHLRTVVKEITFLDQLDESVFELD